MEWNPRSDTLKFLLYCCTVDWQVSYTRGSGLAILERTTTRNWHTQTRIHIPNPRLTLMSESPSEKESNCNCFHHPLFRSWRPPYPPSFPYLSHSSVLQWNKWRWPTQEEKGDWTGEMDHLLYCLSSLRYFARVIIHQIQSGASVISTTTTPNLEHIDQQANGAKIRPKMGNLWVAVAVPTSGGSIVAINMSKALYFTFTVNRISNAWKTSKGHKDQRRKSQIIEGGASTWKDVWMALSSDSQIRSWNLLARSRVTVQKSSAVELHNDKYNCLSGQNMRLGDSRVENLVFKDRQTPNRRLNVDNAHM